MSITTEELRRVLSYDNESGVFRWNVNMRNRRNRGKIAGSSYQSSGYARIKIFGKTYKSHALAWQYVNGEEPSNQIDHINGVKDDNRISNLRICSASQNKANCGIQKNNTSGMKGVSWNIPHKKWMAQIRFKGKLMNLGYFKDLQIAAIVYDITALELFGKFSKTNF